MRDFIEKKINFYADTIIKGSDKRDAHALGELTFYMSIRRVFNAEATPQDLGLVDAINDTLQEAGLISSSETFINKIK